MLRDRGTYILGKMTQRERERERERDDGVMEKSGMLNERLGQQVSFNGASDDLLATKVGSINGFYRQILVSSKDFFMFLSEALDTFALSFQKLSWRLEYASFGQCPSVLLGVYGPSLLFRDGEQ